MFINSPSAGNRDLSAQAGSSVLAAIALAASFGLVTMVLINVPSENPQAQMAQAAAPSAVAPTSGAVKTEQLSSQCTNGEVHTVRESTTKTKSLTTGVGDTDNWDLAGKPVDTISKCWIRDPKIDPKIRSVLIRSPTYTSDPACKFSNQEKCVVRYCPVTVTADGKKDACTVIPCKAGDTECVKKGTNAALNTNPVAAIADLQGLGAVAQNADGSATKFEDILKKDAYSAVETTKKITETSGAIADIDREIDNCLKGISSPSCKNDLQDLRNTQGTLQQDNLKLQAQLDEQMKNLALNQTTTMTPPDGSDPTGSRLPPDIAALERITTTQGSFVYPITPGQIQTLEKDGFKCTTDPSQGTECFKPTSGTPLPRPRPSDAPAPPPPPVAPPSPPSTGFSGNPNGGTLGGGTGGGDLMRAATQSGLFYQLGRMLGGLISGNGIGGQQQSQQQPQQQIACATNQDQYRQQQEQYNQQIQQYQYQLQQYQYQQQQQQQQYQQYQQQQQQQYSGGGYRIVSTDPMIVVPVNSGGYQNYGGYNPGYTQQQPPPPPPQQPPQPCYNNQSPQQCSYSPQQPNQSACTSGSWKPTTSGNGCVSGWQCVPSGANGTGGGTAGTQPAAAISCQPKIADVGMTLAISFSCSNATGSKGSGFDTGNALSGSATTTIQKPPAGTNTATYTLTCSNGSVAAGAQCAIQIGKPNIVFVPNPPKVHSGESSTLGWITSGMLACVVSSPDRSDFTAQNAGTTNPNGVATASNITANTRFFLNCQTAGGGTANASTTVLLIGN
ncbi:MAG: hypothetical protein Q8R25_00920 [bacterium]|nr:hypothetical protein [bacterium]